MSYANIIDISNLLEGGNSLMKCSFVTGMVIGGLAVGGTILFTSPEAKSRYEPDLVLLKENFVDQISKLKEEVNELILIGQANAYRLERYLQDRMPALMEKIESLLEDVSDIFSDLKEALENLADLALDLWNRSSSYVSSLINR